MKLVGTQSGVMILLVLAVATSLVASCGKPDQESSPGKMSATVVKGAGLFGSQCPYGSVRDAYPVKLKLQECPLGLAQLELAEPLHPIVISADCHEMTLTIRDMNGKLEGTWLVMPDGTFDITVDGGAVRMKSDGFGHDDCSIVSAARLKGRMYCKPRGDRDIDKVNIVFDTYWNLGEKAPPPTNASPSPSPSPSPTATPWPWPTPTPSPSSSWPWPMPSWNPRPTPTPTSTGSWRFPIRMEMSAPTAPASECHLPKGCYLWANTKIKQCQTP
jgi:hypothetical protein